jgi:hypothetical protein
VARCTNSLRPQETLKPGGHKGARKNARDGTVLAANWAAAANINWGKEKKHSVAVLLLTPVLVALPVVVVLSQS